MFASKDSAFIKPSPRPRGVIRSHILVASDTSKHPVSTAANGSYHVSQGKSSPDAKPRKVITVPQKCRLFNISTKSWFVKV